VERFKQTLNRNYGDDATCMRVTANKEFARCCAVMLRRYVDSDFTRWLSADRRVRLGTYRAWLVEAIGGLEAAAKLYRHRDSMRAAAWLSDAAELQAELLRVDELLDTQRHGKVRDHGILDVARQEMEKTLGSITDKTLANLVSAAFEAHGIYQEPMTEEMVQRNLANYRQRNVNWPRKT